MWRFARQARTARSPLCCWQSDFLIKAGAIGVHVWLPGAYAEAEDDVSALLSAVVSKARCSASWSAPTLRYAGANLDLAHLMGWLGMLTTFAGAIMAVRQDE